ncbi:MAG: hypothetical protein QM783_16685 [Phycisphaerales bacterium]
MAGYSGTPLPQKLGIKPDSSLFLVNAPDGFQKTLGTLPEGVAQLNSPTAKGPFDVIVAFLDKPAQLDQRLSSLRPKMATHCGLWFAWKKGQKGPGVLGENMIRDAALAAGLVDNKVCAIDEAWSGLRCVIPVAKR